MGVFICLHFYTAVYYSALPNCTPEMATENIGYNSIRKAVVKPTRYEIHDKRLTGFFVMVLPSGRKNFYVQLGRGKRKKIGSYPEMTVEFARERATDMLRQVVQPELTLRSFIEEKSIKTDWIRMECCFGEKGAGVLDKPLHEIPLDTIDTWRREREKAGLKPSTINRDVTRLKSILSQAVMLGRLAEHPLKKLKPLKELDDDRVRYLEDDERSRLKEALNASEPYLKTIVIVALNSGMRRGEIFNLKWADINFKLGQITVQASGTKARKKRYVQMNDVVSSELHEWRKHAVGEYVFNGKNGKLTDVKKSFATLMKRAEIKDFHFHDMRHDFASQLVMMGEPLYTVKELLGHASIKMTERYAHLSPKVQKKAVSRLKW